VPDSIAEQILRGSWSGLAVVAGSASKSYGSVKVRSRSSGEY